MEELRLIIQQQEKRIEELTHKNEQLEAMLLEAYAQIAAQKVKIGVQIVLFLPLMIFVERIKVSERSQTRKAVVKKVIRAIRCAVANKQKEVGKNAEKVVEFIRKETEKSAVVGADETGISLNGKKTGFGSFKRNSIHLFILHQAEENVF